MTIRDFRAEHEVSEPSFFAWRRTITERDRQLGGPRASADDDGEKTQDTPNFVPLRVVSPPAGTSFEVVLRDGFMVRVPWRSREALVLAGRRTGDLVSAAGRRDVHVS